MPTADEPGQATGQATASQAYGAYAAARARENRTRAQPSSPEAEPEG
jgi:hypothetical protein